MIEIHRVITSGQIKITSTLAHEIWNQHYVPMIGQAQVDYMLANVQSVSAMTQQMADGYEYYLVTDHDTPVGYFAIVPTPATLCALLSKIYVVHTRRGTGLGKNMMMFIEKRCVELGLSELWLTVNRNNSDSIAFYRRMGFTVTGNVVQDIGNGFVMDDYRMAKKAGVTVKDTASKEL